MRRVLTRDGWTLVGFLTVYLIGLAWFAVGSV